MVAAGNPPEFSLRGISDSKVKGAALGAGVMFLQCNAALPPSRGSGAMCG